MKNTNYNKNGDGFTLIELLVVISIIGLLASVVLVALNGARQKARVSKRAADLAQISKGLELYYNANNAYPITIGNWYTACSGWVSTSTNSVIPGLVPTYMSGLPVDPSMNAGANQNCYLYNSNGTDYKFLDYNVTDMTLADINKYPTLKDPCRNDAVGSPCGYADSSNSLTIFTPGGRNW